MGANYSFQPISIETSAPHPQFIGHNKVFLGSVINNKTQDLTTLKPDNQQETDLTEVTTPISDVTTDSDPAKEMGLPPDFEVSNESVDDLNIENHESLSQTQIIIIGGAGGGCLLIILGKSMSLKFRYCEMATKCKKNIPPLFYSLDKFETKYIKLKTKTQNNISIFGTFHKIMILLFWLF